MSDPCLKYWRQIETFNKAIFHDEIKQHTFGTLSVFSLHLKKPNA